MSVIDRESAELERAYPGILARLESEPPDAVARRYRLSIGSVYAARDRVRRLRRMEEAERGSAAPQTAPEAAAKPAPAPTPVIKTVHTPPAPAPAVAPTAPAPAPAPLPVSVKDAGLQASLEAAYPGITVALSRRDDVEVAIQYGIGLEALARIRDVLGVQRAASAAPSAPVVLAPAPTKALPTRLVASKD